MARKLAAVALFGGVAFVLAVGSSVGQEKKDEKKKDDKKKTPSIKAIMKALNPPKGKVGQIDTAAKDDKWDDAKKLGAEIKEMGEALGKNTPKKGDKDAWEAIAKTYAETATAIADGADKKDATAVADAVKTFKGACMTCHKAHK